MKTRIVTSLLAFVLGASFRAVADTTYNLEELDFSWMSSGWEHPVANKSIFSISDGSYTSLQVWNGTEWQTYSRGISVQTESHWFINLGGEGKSFSATVGLDKSADGDGRNGSKKVKFAVVDVVGGTNLAETAWMGTTDTAATLTADLTGVELIELVVYPDPDNGDGWQHVDWCEPVIVMAGEAEPVTKGPNHWVGRGTDTNWDTAANWEFGVPREDATAVFDDSTTVYLDTTKTISNIVVNAGATVKFRTGRLWAVWPSLIIQETGGDGTMQFSVAGLQANHVNSDKVYINTANIEFLPSETDCWFTGGGAEGQEFVVNSRVVVQGFMRAYASTHIVGDLVLDGGSIYLSDKAVVEKLVLDSALEFGKSNDNPPVDSTGTIKEVVVHGTTYDYSAFADKTWPLTIDGATVDIGDGSSIGEGGLEIGVLSGGYLRYTVSEIPETDVPDFPVGLTFAADADLSNVFAIVNNTEGNARKIYAITKNGDVYSFAEAIPTDTVKWIGGVDDRWYTGGNWIYGAAPTATQTAVFERSAYIYLDDSVAVATASNVTIAAGATVTLCTTAEWSAKPRLEMQEITGEGTLALKRAMLTSVRHDGSARIACKELCIVAACSQSPDTGVNYVEYFDSQIGGSSQSPNAPVLVTADITGGGYLKLRYGVKLYGDNSGFRGVMGTVAVNDYWSGVGGEKCFCTPESLFSSAYRSELNGRIQLLFDNATVSFGNVAMLESYGTGLYLPYGTENLTIEVTGGTIRDNYQGLGCGVYTRAEGSESIDGATVGCAGLTIKKVGEGTLVYGLTKAHNLVVAEGRVEFTGENNNGDDADVNVTVKAGASIGSSESLGCGWDNDTQSYKNGFVGGDVTVRHQFAFEPGGAIKQEYIATTTTDEQTQEETTTYSMRKLTIADDVDLANVVFGVTNPEALPAVTKELTRDRTQRFTMFAANSLSGTVATEDGGYAPDGSEKHGAWVARLSRSADNVVEFRPYVKSGFAVNIR